VSDEVKYVHLDGTPAYKPGDPRPEGYLNWMEWAKVQHGAGLKQTQCSRCGLWRFPQEKCCGPDKEQER
jgi:hypothetical protein